MLKDRKVVPLRTFLAELEVSRATFKRDLSILRDQFRVEVKYDPEARGYRWPNTNGDGARIELPGPLYTPAEIDALLLMQDLITQLQPGLLDQHLGPLRQRLKLLLGAELPSDEVRRRIRILHAGSRPVEPKRFRAVSEATLGRRRLWIRYDSRSRGSCTERTVSPQRLVFYRGNWYVDSWCHVRHDLRSFAVDAILEAKVLAEDALSVEEEALDAHLGAGYGIFSGAVKQVATLRFDAEAARWVSKETWHVAQEMTAERDGGVTLTVPYSNDRELLMDVLRWGPHVQVIGPKSLRDNAKEWLSRALSRY